MTSSTATMPPKRRVRSRRQESHASDSLVYPPGSSSRAAQQGGAGHAADAAFYDREPGHPASSTPTTSSTEGSGLPPTEFGRASSSSILTCAAPRRDAARRGPGRRPVSSGQRGITWACRAVGADQADDLTRSRQRRRTIAAKPRVTTCSSGATRAAVGLPSAAGSVRRPAGEALARLAAGLPSTGVLCPRVAARRRTGRRRRRRSGPTRRGRARPHPPAAPTIAISCRGEKVEVEHAERPPNAAGARGTRSPTSRRTETACRSSSSSP